VSKPVKSTELALDVGWEGILSPTIA